MYFKKIKETVTDVNLVTLVINLKFNNIMTLEECKNNIGRKVTYIPFKGCNPKLYEEGVITSTNDKNVFVRYGSDINSKATDPEDLIL